VNALVIGAGAVGSLLAWALATGGMAVTLVRRRASDHGPADITVVAPGGSPRTARVAISLSAAQFGTEPDLIILAVRTFDVRAAIDSVPSPSGATFVTVQNGIGTEELVRELRPSNAIVAASLTASIDLAQDGSIRWLTRGGIGLASLDGAAPALPGLVAAFRQSGLRPRTYPDWRAMKWSKLIANLVGNATSALVDLPVSDVYAHPGLFEVEREQLREAFDVVGALGLKPVSLPGADVPRLELALGLPSPVARTILRFAVGGGRGGKDPSLRLALGASAERTEVDWLNGAVSRTGTELGMETPVNRALTELVTQAASHSDVRNRLRGRPEAVVEAIRQMSHPQPVKIGRQHLG
jgi:2-dehydropantoate 2-reductase